MPRVVRITAYDNVALNSHLDAWTGVGVVSRSAQLGVVSRWCGGG